MPKGPGRKTKLTAALQQAIVNAVAAGVSLACAAELAGISPLSVKEWIQRGKGEDPDRPPTPLYTSFSQAVIRAKAQDETRRVARINQAGQGGAVIYRKTLTYRDGSTAVEERHAPPDWQADAWHLERSRKEEWGRPVVQKIALTSPDGETAWAPQVVYLPAKAPTPEEWSANIAGLLPSVRPLEAEA